MLETRFEKSNDLQLHSDYYVQDASFIRLDNVRVGYTFNQKPNSTSLVNLTLSAQNVLIITKYHGLDPEVATDNTSGIDNNLYPRPITFTLGLNVNF
jgi:iron complex outermembrane receptor protein